MDVHIDTRIPPPVMGIIAGLAIWLLHKPFAGLAVAFPAQSALALFIGGAALILEMLAIATFFKARTTVNPLRPQRASSLVTSGIFQISRNPMYLAMAGLLLAWTIWLGQPLGLIIIALFILAITRWQIIPEERVLLANFGRDYQTYCAKVRRWI